MRLQLFLVLFLILLGCMQLYAQHPSLNSNVFYELYPALFAGSAPLAVPLQMRWIAIQSEARMEVLCVYHLTCKGKFLKGTLRRPLNEFTPYNKNVAIAYASRKLIIDQSPWAKATIDAIFVNLGFNTTNESMNISTPIGVGNTIANTITRSRHHDGMNQLGDIGGYRYPQVNFSDYTGYQPVNNHLHLYDPDSWQPLVNVDAKLRPVSQIYLLPHLVHLKTWVVNTSAASVPNQRDRYSNNRRKYMQKVNNIINIQKRLTDRQKMVAEWFDNKLRSFNLMGEFLINKYGNGTLEFHTLFNFVVNSVIHEAMAPVWKLKTTYDAIRPISAIRHLKKGKIVRGWGGPGKGIVNMDGKEWRSYLPTDAFPDYPSGTSCLCSAWTEAAKKLIGTNIIDYSITFPIGSSFIEPGVTPTRPLTLSYHTLDEVAEDCMWSRVWAGVHFVQAVEEARNLCAPYGRQFYDRAIKMLAGHL